MLSKSSILTILPSNFLIISNIYLPWITVVPTSFISSNLLLSINDSILISLSLALKNKPSFVKLNFIPDNTGIKFLLDKALLTEFKLWSKTSFLY